MKTGQFLRFPAALVTGDPKSSNPAPAAWFNQAAFRPLAAFTPRENPWQHEGITGPGFVNLDLTLAKVFAITESKKLKFKMESYNASNSFWWDNPIMSAASVGTSQLGRSVAQNREVRGREFQYSLKLIF